MTVDYNLSEKEVKEIAGKLCGENDFELLHVRELNSNPEDGYLRFVLAQNRNTQEYATWLLNLSMGGLVLGHYFSYREVTSRTQESAFKKALDDFINRS